MPKQQYVLDGIPEDTLNSPVIDSRRFKVESYGSAMEAPTKSYYTYNPDGSISTIQIFDTITGQNIEKKYSYNASGQLLSIVVTDRDVVDCSNSIGGVNGTEFILDNTLSISCVVCKEA